MLPNAARRLSSILRSSPKYDRRGEPHPQIGQTLGLKDMKAGPSSENRYYCAVPSRNETHIELPSVFERVFTSPSFANGPEVRVNAVVHLKTVVSQGAMVPIGWIAVGDPARILSPDQHDAIWAIQKPRALTGANGMSRVRQRSCASSAVGMCPRPGDTFGKRSRHPIGGTGGDHRSQPGPSL